MTTGKRSRLGRTPPRILRNTDGDSYAIEAHLNTPPHVPTCGGVFCVRQLEFDDGNGLWITSGETPCDQGLFCKYHPQGYTPREA